MQYLKANTQVKVVIGPFVDESDGKTPETGITLGAADEAELMKHDASAVTDISAATWAAITSMDGYYNLTLTTSHTDTEGMLTIAIQDDSVCLPVRAVFMVLSEAAYDSMFAAKDAGFMDVNIKTVGRADAQETEANNLETACANYSATRGLTGTALPAVAAGAAGGIPTDSTGKTSFNDLSAAQVNTECDTALSDYGPNTTVPPTAAAIADQVWDEIKTGHTINGSFGEEVQEHATPTEVNAQCDTALTDYGANTTTPPTAAAIADQVWDEAKSGHVGAGSFGEEVQNHSLSSEISALNNVSAAQVNAEVKDVLETDTHAEPSGVVAATASIKDMINWLKTLARNKLTQTATTATLRNDADSADIATSTVSDNGTTATRGEWS